MLRIKKIRGKVFAMLYIFPSICLHRNQRGQYFLQAGIWHRREIITPWITTCSTLQGWETLGGWKPPTLLFTYSAIRKHQMLPLRALVLFLFFCKTQCAKLPRDYRDLRHSVSYLLDGKNNSIKSGLLVQGSKVIMNATVCSSAFNSISGRHFRYKRYPAAWNRYDSSWYSIPSLRLPSLKESGYRVLLSSVRSELGDGLGHMVTISSSAHKCTTCESVNGDGPLGFKHIVALPSFLVYNCTSKHKWGPKCDELAHQTLSNHNRSYTIFQMPPGGCNYDGTNTNMTETGSWFYSKYWELHGRVVNSAVKKKRKPMSKRIVNFNPRNFNIAVHIRRGDFFNESKRRMFPDKVYARTISDVLDIVDSMEGIFSKTAPIVHIYSEGKRRLRAGLTAHDVDGMDKTYYDESHTSRSRRDWEQLIKLTKKSDGRLKDTLRQRIKVQLHISEDTLRSMHEMISADVFIGSDSSMSLGPIYMLSRGVRLVITEGLRPNDYMHSHFDPNTGNITSSSNFVRAWTLYEAGNGNSLLRSFRSLPSACESNRTIVCVEFSKQQNRNMVL